MYRLNEKETVIGADGRSWCPYCKQRPKVTAKGLLASHRAKSGKWFSRCAGVGMREFDARKRYAAEGAQR